VAILRQSGEKPNFYLQNVECALYPRGDDPESQIAGFRAAFEELATIR
jgi:hypothetical protein